MSRPITKGDAFEGRIELDSHADTCVLGRNFVILSYSGKECEVLPYSDEYDSVKNVPIVTGATAWTLPIDYQKVHTHF